MKGGKVSRNPTARPRKGNPPTSKASGNNTLYLYVLTAF